MGQIIAIKLGTYVNNVTQLRITMNHINLFLSKTEYIYSCKKENINHDFLFFSIQSSLIV